MNYTTPIVIKEETEYGNEINERDSSPTTCDSPPVLSDSPSGSSDDSPHNSSSDSEYKLSHSSGSDSSFSCEDIKEEGKSAKNAKEFTKRILNACDMCTRRKRRCTGDIPCLFCKTHGIACTYLKPNKNLSRTMKKHYRVVSPSNEQQSLVIRHSNDSFVGTFMSENELSDKFEKLLLVDMYFDYYGPCFHKTREQVINPATSAQKMFAYSVLATFAQATGQLSRARTFLEGARTLAAETLDEVSFEAVTGFMALSLCHLMDDHKFFLYGNIAKSMAQSLSVTNSQEKKLVYLTAIPVTMMDSSIDVLERQQIVMAQIAELMALSGPWEMFFALMAKIFCTLLPKINHFFCKPEHLKFFKRLDLTADESNALLSDIQIAEWLVRHHVKEFGKAQQKMLGVVMAHKALIMWSSGDVKNALFNADRASEIILGPTVYIPCDIPLLYILSQFYLFVGEHEKANKVFDRFTNLCMNMGLTSLHETLYSNFTAEANNDENNNNNINSNSIDSDDVDITNLLLMDADSSDSYSYNNSGSNNSSSDMISTFYTIPFDLTTEGVNNWNV